MTAKTVDQIKLQVIHYGLLAIANEMKATVMRSAYSPLWKEAGDMACALLDASGDVVAQGFGDTPIQLGTMPLAVKACLETIPAERMEPGDVVIQNDPFRGNNHLPDVLLAKPIFAGGTLVGFAAVRGHFVDIGGVGPGSMAVTGDMYGEGLRIPPLKLYVRGELNEDVAALIGANVRRPRDRFGDLRAAYGGTQIGDRRVQTLAERHGPDALLAAMAQILDLSERQTRSAIRSLRPGTYTFEDFLDDDGAGAQAVRIAVTIQVRSDEIIVDFAGSAPQVGGNVNAPFGVTCAATYFAVKCLTDPEHPANSGCFRPVHVRATPGTLVHALEPAAVANGNTETATRIVDVVLGALAQAAPGRAVAAGAGTVLSLLVGGRARAADPGFVFVEVHGGAQGAGASTDGISATRVGGGNTGNTSVESLESHFPIFVEHYDLATGSAGSGTFRGGLGLRRRMRFETDVTVTLSGDRCAHRPYGLEGGRPAASAECTLEGPGGERRALTSLKTAPILVPAGSTIELRAPGGGGYGAPELREPARVLRDVEDGYITPEAAATDYGVAVRPSGGPLGRRWAVDEHETHDLRARMAGRPARPMAPVQRRGCRLAPAASRRK